jgi:DNA-nicking Smr family endonuclease
MSEEDDRPHEYPIDGTLDLHQFSPKETREVVSAYLGECLARGITRVRIVHGKGIGAQREIVRSFLAKDPRVKSFRQEGGSGGDWGATVVDLKTD